MMTSDHLNFFGSVRPAPRLQGVENLPVEQLIPQFPIEVLLETFLPRTAGFNAERFDPRLCRIHPIDPHSLQR